MITSMPLLNGIIPATRAILIVTNESNRNYIVSYQPFFRLIRRSNSQMRSYIFLQCFTTPLLTKCDKLWVEFPYRNIKISD